MARLARSIHQNGDFTESTGRVSTSVFNPGKYPALSVIQADELSTDDVFTICDVVGQMRGKPAVAFAELLETDLPEPLSYERDDDPFDRHGNILGWPNDRREKKALATLLSSRARLVVRPRAA